MKYKVGDKVKIKGNLIIGKTYGGLYLYGGAVRHIGEETIVTKVEKERYRLAVDNSSRIWAYEMLEPVEELTAEEAIRILGGMCRDLSCCECPIYELIEDVGSCDNLRAEKPDKVIEVLKQWKKDHEKKPIETENVSHLCVSIQAVRIQMCNFGCLRWRKYLMRYITVTQQWMRPKPYIIYGMCFGNRN